LCPQKPQRNSTFVNLASGETLYANACIMYFHVFYLSFNHNALIFWARTVHIISDVIMTQYEVFLQALVSHTWQSQDRNRKMQILKVIHLPIFQKFAFLKNMKSGVKPYIYEEWLLQMWHHLFSYYISLFHASKFLITVCNENFLNFFATRMRIIITFMWGRFRKSVLLTWTATRTRASPGCASLKKQ